MIIDIPAIEQIYRIAFITARGWTYHKIVFITEYEALYDVWTKPGYDYKYGSGRKEHFELDDAYYAEMNAK